MEQKSNTYGYDAQGEKYVDFIDAGIVDPTKVVRVALQNAASVAGLLITTEAMITDRPKKDAGPQCPAAAAAWAAAWAIWTSNPRPASRATDQPRRSPEGGEGGYPSRMQKGRSNPALFFCGVRI